MRIDKKSYSGRYDISTDGDLAVSPLVRLATFGGLSVTVAVQSLLLWGLLSIAYTQEIVSWRLEWWQYPAASFLYILHRALNKVLWSS